MNQEPKGRNDGHEFDYSQIEDRIYIGSDLCKGNICPVHSEDFKRLGVCVEINLSAEKKETPPDNIDSYTWMPVVDGYPPNPAQLDMGTTIMDEAISNGKTVYIHCRNGHGRSPTLVAAYMIRYGGMSADEAERKIKENRSEIHIEDSQMEALRKFSTKWSK